MYQRLVSGLKVRSRSEKQAPTARTAPSKRTCTHFLIAHHPWLRYDTLAQRFLLGLAAPHAHGTIAERDRWRQEQKGWATAAEPGCTSIRLRKHRGSTSYSGASRSGLALETTGVK
jgi:hypothetical protein